MPKYTFSQGKIWVEEGVYQPLLKRRPPHGDTFVLLLVIQSQAKSSDESAPKDKEQDDVQST